MALRTGDDGQAIIKDFEGLGLIGYRCPAGIPTIGWGHTEAAGGVINYADGSHSTKVIVGKAIKKVEAERLFRADLDRFEDKVEKLLKVEVEPYEFDAVVALAYNIGPGDNGLKGSTVLRKLNAGDDRGAAKAFAAWNKATIPGKGKVVVRGLVRRREAEQALYEGDVEKARLLAGSTRKLPMPQRVAKPEKQDTILNNNQIVAGGGAAVAVGTSALNQAQEAADKVSQARGIWDQLTDTLEVLATSPRFWIYAVGGVLCGYLVFKGYQTWRDTEQDGDEDEQVDVEEVTDMLEEEPA